MAHHNWPDVPGFGPTLPSVYQATASPGSRRRRRRARVARRIVIDATIALLPLALLALIGFFKGLP